MDEVISALEEAFLSYSLGKTVVPVRLPLEIKPYKGICLLMPSFQEGPDGLGVKIVSVFPENVKRNMPTLSSYYLYCDPQTGALLSLLDGAILTGLRTGGASGLASRYLAKKDSKILGIFGAGYQSRFQLEAMRTVLPSLRKAYVVDVDQGRVNEFIADLKDAGIELEAASDPDGVVKESDVIITATTSRSPVFDGKHLRPGTHVNAIGGFTPAMQEVDEETVRKAKVVVDTYEGCLSESGELLIPMQKGSFSKERIHSDLAGLVSGKKPGRESPNEITLFKSVGTALEDLAAARLAYQKALERGMGLPFEL
jgi:alanine dehydrogenase